MTMPEVRDGRDRDAARRAELGEFLRTRRERLQPEAAGLKRTGRRRTPGLRREEVAQLAGISAAWYTWLEQGREIRVSPEVMHRIADALHLTPDERRHLLLLADRGVTSGGPFAREAVSPKLRRVLEGMRDLPACVIGPYAELLAASPAMQALLPPLHEIPGEKRNLLVFVFTSPEVRERLSDWESMARECLAHFRSVYAARVGDPRAERVVARLRRESPEFALWWDRYELEPAPSGPVVLEHPGAGTLVLDHVLLSISESAGLTLGLLSPADGATRGRIRRLVQAAEHRPAAVAGP
ncbi:MAG TPA: helix-turn-helix transcriptional regulator [Longimicrobiaceae bacterium]|jgi:transcriptional regulator with XRE-family HTH domain